MKQLNISITLVLLCSLFVSSANFSLDPNDYEPIPYEYQSMSFKPLFDLHGDYEKEKEENQKEYEDKDNKNELKAEILINYLKIKSTLLRYHERRLSLTPLSINTQKSDYKQNIRLHTIRKSRHYGASLSGSFTYRRYNSPETFFLEAEPTFSFSGSFNGPLDKGNNYEIKKERKNYTTGSISEVTTSKSEEEHREHYERGFNNNSLSLSAGYGRVSDIGYSAVAIHIMHYLQEHNLLYNETKETLIRLSQRLETLKRERVLDRRESKIEHISKICNWLERENITKELLPIHIMKIADIWDYAFTQKRGKGHTIKLGMYGENRFSYKYKTELEILKQFDTTLTDHLVLSDEVVDSLFLETPIIEVYNSEKTIDQNYTVGPRLRWNIHKSIGMKKHLSCSTDIRAGRHFDKPFKEEISKTNSLRAYIDLSYAIYPSMRSTVTINNGCSYYKLYRKQRNFDYYNSDRWINTSNLTLTYYLSPRVSFSTYGRYSLHISRYKDEEERYDKKIRGFYSLRSSLTFKLF